MVTVVEYRQRDHTVREQRRGFRAHAIVYAVVTPLMIVGNLVVIATTDADVLWFPFPLVGWGLGLLNHHLWGALGRARDPGAPGDDHGGGGAEMSGPGAARRT